MVKPPAPRAAWTSPPTRIWEAISSMPTTPSSSSHRHKKTSDVRQVLIVQLQYSVYVSSGQRSKSRIPVRAHGHLISLLMATEWRRSITLYTSAVTNPPMAAVRQRYMKQRIALASSLFRNSSDDVNTTTQDILRQLLSKLYTSLFTNK